jgi:hypothetical protein
LTTLYGYRNEHWRFSPAPNATDAERQTVAEWGRLPDEVPSTQGTQLGLLVEDMRAGRQPERSGLVQVRKSIELLLSAYKAACTGQPVARGSITPEDPYYRGMAHALSVTTKEHA